MNALVLTLALCANAQEMKLGGRMVDLTHAVEEKSSFGVEKHEGTHVDAPKIASHGPKAKSVDELPAERMISRFVLVDVSRWADKNRNYQARVSDLADWEKYHGRMPERAVVLIRTGYSKHWGNREKYLGTLRRGKDAAEYLRFPGLHPSAAEWLVKRGAAGVGIDSARVDNGTSRDFLTSKGLAEAGLPVYENLDNLDELPETGGWLIATPMKVKGAASAPARVLAVLEQQ
jgi:kynurenine formamidase